MLKLRAFLGHYRACRRAGFGRLDALVSARHVARFEADEFGRMEDTRSPEGAVTSELEARNIRNVVDWRRRVRQARDEAAP